MKVYQNVQFRTLDGIYLRGRLYAAAQKGPAVILCPGYNSVVDSFPAGVPEEFQKAGITALLYDPRNTGKSGGFPRNDIDPFKQVEDYSDAFCFLTTLPIVDTKAIVFWGISLSAGIALSAASLDKRIVAVIAVAPVFKFLPVTEKDARRLKTKMIKDRESQLLRGNPPYVLPIAESLAEIPFNSHVNANRGDDEEQRKRAEEEQIRQQQERWKEEAVEANQEFDEKLIHNPYGTTIQSYHRMFLFESIPLSMVKGVWPTPVMFLTPEKDQISPPQHQIDVFESLQDPKRQVFAPGKEHVYVMEGTDVPLLVKLQVEFVWQAVRGRLKAAT